MKMHIAKLLLKEDMVTIDQIREAIENISDTGRDLGEALIDLGYITETELLDFLGKSYGVPVISIDDHTIENEVLELIPAETAIENRLIPLSITGSALTVAMSDPSNILLVDELIFLTGKNIIPVVVSKRSVVSMLEKYYGYRKPDTDSSQDNITVDSALDSSPGIPASGKENSKQDIDEIMKELEDFINNRVSLDDPPTHRSNTEQMQDGTPEGTSDADQIISNYRFGQDEGNSEEFIDETPAGVSSEVEDDPLVFEETGVSALDSERISGETKEPADNEFSGGAEEEFSAGQSVSRNGEGADVPAGQGRPSGEHAERLNEYAHNPEDDTKTVQETKTKPEPLKTPDAEDSQKDSRPAVLVIDASRTVQKLISLALNRKGYDVSAVSDGMEALACLNTIKPDLIFIEIHLPHMDGYQVCKIIKSHGLMKDVPIVMLSGKEGLFDKVRSKMAGANGHIAKPFGSDALIGAAQRYTS